MEIKLQSGQICLIDEEDFPLVSQYKWYLSKFGYAVRNRKYKKNIPDSGNIFMHRLIKNPKQGFFVDHINGNKLDNRKENLRLCTMAENNFGRGRKSDNTSGFKGVHFNKDTGKWMARVSAYGNRKYLGLFKTKELAYEAYKTAAKEMHKEFSRLV